MKICKKCNKEIPNRQWRDGKQYELKSRSYCLDCSPPGSRNGYFLRKEKTKEKLVDRQFKVCPICQRTFKHTKNDVCSSCRCSYRRLQLRQKAIELLGGKCQRCGCNDQDVLTFHHKDKNEKNFNLSANWQGNWELLESELVKCELLCSNCHIKHHKTESNNRINQIQEYYKNMVR